jgi:hypothetical protein
MVEYCVADLLQGLAAWCAGFDVGVESYTLQVLPPVLRRDAMAAIARFVKAHGLLLVIARGREESEAAGEMPWPLTQAEACSFQEYGLQLCFFRDYLDTETPPVRRFQLCFQKQGNGGSPVSD